MEKSTDIIILAANVIITAVVIVALFSLFNAGQSFVNQTTSTINDSSIRLEQAQYTKYDNLEVSGSDALSAARKFGMELPQGVTIIIYKTQSDFTNKTNAVTLTNYVSSVCNDTWKRWQNVPNDASKYVNPAATFKAEVTYDPDTNYATKITFTMSKFASIVTVSDVMVAAEGELSTYASGATETNTSLYTGSDDTDEDDLSVIFSDEQDVSDEESWTLGSINERISEFTESLQSISNKLSNLDENTLEEASVLEIKSELEALQSDVQELREKYVSSDELSADNRSFVEKSTSDLLDAIQSAIESLNDLQVVTVEGGE